MALPGGPLEICFSFDTTASMTKYIDEVKARLQSMVQKLQADIPGIRIALCAHGDYYFKSYDNKSPYEMTKLDFTNDVVELCQFIQKAEPTFGGDWEEFYEYVLKEARETLSWSPHTNKVFVLIGDAEAHPMDDEYNLKKIDWRHEVREFVKQGVTVYGTYCKTPFSQNYDLKFFKELSKLGGGSFLKIQDFEDIFDTLMAICYREQGETALQALEFYEYVLKEARETLSWSPHTNKVFVLIGDAEAHPMDDEYNLKKIDWRHEVREFVKQGVTVYGTYCKTPFSQNYDLKFFKELSKLGGGSFLKIQDFEDIFDTLMAICYREQGETALQALESYEREVNARQTGPSKDVNTVFTTLKKSASNASSTSAQLLQNLNKTRQSKPTNTKKTTAKGTTTTGVKNVRFSCKLKPVTIPTNANVKKTKTMKQVTKPVTMVTKTSKPRNTGVSKASRKVQSKAERTKLRRERVPETNFLLREQSWSRWKPAFFCKCLGSNFIRRKSGVGFRAEKLFKTSNKIKTWLYEFSVSVKPGSRKVVVFRLSAVKEETNIEKLLKSTSVKSRLENVLKKGCYVFVRRLAVSRSNVQKQVDDADKLYSYLWDADCTRAFVKDDVEM